MASILDDFDPKAGGPSILDDFAEPTPTAEPEPSILAEFERGDAPEEGHGIMRETILPLLADVAAGGATGMMIGSGGGPLAALAGGAIGGVVGGFARRGVQEALTDQEYEKVFDVGSSLSDGAWGGAGGIAVKGISSLAGKVFGSGSKVVQAAPAKLSEVMPRGETGARWMRLVDSMDDLRGDTAVSTGIKRRQMAGDLFKGGIIDEEQFGKWSKTIDDELDAARPDVEAIFPKGNPMTNARRWLSRPHRNMQKMGDELIERGDEMSVKQGRYLRAMGDAMEMQGEYARRFRTIYDPKVGEIRSLLSKETRENFRPIVEGKVMGPHRPSDQLGIDKWRDLQDDIAELSEMEGLLTSRGGTWLPFQKVQGEYVPHFGKPLEAGMKRTGGSGSKALGERARLPVDLDDPNLIDDFDEIVRRQRLRDSDRLASSALFGGLTPEAVQATGKVGGESAMPGLAREGLALLQEVGQREGRAELIEAHDHLTHFMKATHSFDSFPERTFLERLKSMGASAVLNRNWSIQLTEVSKAAAYSGGVSDVVRGRPIMTKRFPNMAGQIGSTASDIGESVGKHHAWWDPTRAATAADSAARKIGTYGAAGMVQRVSKQAADAVAKGGKFKGSLLREASEITGRFEKAEDAVRYLARRWSANGNDVAEDVVRDGVDRLVGRWFYNLDPGTTARAFQHPVGQLGLAFRFYTARAGGHFADDILKPLLKPRDTSEFLLGFRRLTYATGGNFTTAQLHRAIRVMADGKWEDLDPETIGGLAVKDTAGSVAGMGGDLAVAAVYEALRIGDKMDWWEAPDVAKQGGMNIVERNLQIAPIVDIGMGAARDLLSGDMGRTAEGALTVGQGIGGYAPTGSPLSALRALGQIPRSPLKDQEED